MLEKNKNRRKAFLTGLQRNDFLWGEGLGRAAAIISWPGLPRPFLLFSSRQSEISVTIRPCRRPLSDIESEVREWDILPFWKTFVTRKMSTIQLSRGCRITFYITSNLICRFFFPGWGCLCKLSRPPLCHWPLYDVASHVRVKHKKLIWTLYPFERLS